MSNRILVKHKGGGSLTYCMGGAMFRLESGSLGYVPENLVSLHADKLERIPESEAIEHETTMMSRAKAAIRRSWPLKMAPADYLARFGDHGKHSELAREMVNG